MDSDYIALAGFVALFALMLLRVPVGMAMGLVGITGYSYIAGAGPALKLVGQTSMRTVTDYTFGVIPMFMLMGAFVSVKVRPDWLPRGELKPWPERLVDLKNVWAPLVLFLFVIGGLYGGFFTPTEAGGVGASGAFLLGLIRGKLDRAKIKEALLSA